MSEYTVTVQTALMPMYYKEFHCLMGECQDSCCAGWDIEFGKKDYLAVKRGVADTKDPSLQELCRKSMVRLREREHDKLYAEFPMNEADRCGFLREDGLCSLQLGCGEKILPLVCRTFPRLESQTLAAKELSLSPACEGVLALLWGLPDGVEFWEEPLEKKDWNMYEAATPVAARFGDVRSFCIDVLQERSLKLSQRLLLLGMLLQQLREADWQDMETVDTWLEKGERMLHDPAVSAELDQLPRSRNLFLANNHQLMTKAMMSKITGGALARELWSSILGQVPQEDGSIQFSYREDRYQELEEQLEELLGHSEYFFENLMVATAFHIELPTLSDPETMWKSYVNFCNLYSIFRFSAVCGCEKEVSRERLFYVLVETSRSLLHNSIYRSQLRDEFFKNDSATLAHMAILVSG